MFLGGVKNLLKIKLALTQINISKHLMMIDINKGSMRLIPNDLRIQRYPKSFQFYDFIINYIKSNINPQI